MNKDRYKIRPIMRVWLESLTEPCITCGRGTQGDRSICNDCIALGHNACNSGEAWVDALEKLAKGCAGSSSLYVRVSKWAGCLEQWPIDVTIPYGGGNGGKTSPFGKAAKCDLSRRRVVAAAIVKGLL